MLALTNLCNDPDINKDALFLDSMAKLLEMETDFFPGHLRKFPSVYTEARRNDKKRLRINRTKPLNKLLKISYRQ